MYTFIFSGHKAGIVTNEGYIYEYSTLEEAKDAARNATQINVIYNFGQSRQRDVLRDITPAVKQQLEIRHPTKSNIW